MSDGKEAKFCLKVMINEEKTKVLFAEVESDFADVLLSFLTLPLGAIVRVLKKHYAAEPQFGFLTKLYNRLEQLSSDNFCTDGGKQMLLNPRITSFEFESQSRKRKLDISGTDQPIKYFRCADTDCTRHRFPNVSMYYDTMKCDCGKLLSRPMSHVVVETDDCAGGGGSGGGGGGGGGGGVFTEKQVSFLVTDDLLMAPNVPGSVIQTLVNLGITISKGAELRTVTVGFNEIMELLKGSLLSKTPLTDLILHQTNEMASVRGNDLHHRIKQGSKSNSKRMIVKAVVQISTNEFLFYKAGRDFIDFLFSLLTIPLGAVEYLLDGNTSLRNIDNLYRSIIELIDEKYMTSQCTRNRLIKPELPPKYLSKYQIFPLTEQTTPSIYYFESHTVTGSSNTCVEKGYWMCVKDPKGEGCYIKGQDQMYIVLPHLMVIDCISSSIGPILEQLKIPSCDVKELEIEIGLEEALSILKASLVSDSALVDVLTAQVLKEPGEGKK